MDNNNVPQKPPAPVNLEIPMSGNKALYSHMEEFDLRRLRKYLDDLISWKAAGGTIIEEHLYAVIAEKENGVGGDE